MFVHYTLATIFLIICAFQGKSCPAGGTSVNISGVVVYLSSWVLRPGPSWQWCWFFQIIIGCGVISSRFCLSSLDIGVRKPWAVCGLTPSVGGLTLHSFIFWGSSVSSFTKFPGHHNHPGTLFCSLPGRQGLGGFSCNIIIELLLNFCLPMSGDIMLLRFSFSCRFSFSFL